MADPDTVDFKASNCIGTSLVAAICAMKGGDTVELYPLDLFGSSTLHHFWLPPYRSHVVMVSVLMTDYHNICGFLDVTVLQALVRGIGIGNYLYTVVSSYEKTSVSQPSNFRIGLPPSHFMKLIIAQ